MKPEERYVRVCAEHLVPLTGLDCPGKRGVEPHHATRWCTYDREKRKVLDVVDEDKGHTRELGRTGLRVRIDDTSAPASAPAPIKEEDMPKGIPGSGPETKTKPRLLESRRFVVGDDASLRVQLRLVGGKDPASRYRIVWEHTTRQGKTVEMTKGTVSFAATEDQIREAWVEQLQQLDKRWTPAPSSHLKLAPIPAPPKGR